jgi:hypothetical protein
MRMWRECVLWQYGNKRCVFWGCECVLFFTRWKLANNRNRGGVISCQVADLGHTLFVGSVLSAPSFLCQQLTESCMDIQYRRNSSATFSLSLSSGSVGAELHTSYWYYCFFKPFDENWRLGSCRSSRSQVAFLQCVHEIYKESNITDFSHDYRKWGLLSLCNFLRTHNCILMSWYH